MSLRDQIEDASQDALGLGGLVAGAAFALTWWLGIVCSVAFLALWLWRLRMTRSERRSAADEVTRVHASLKSMTSANDLLHRVMEQSGFPAPWRASLFEHRNGLWVRVAQASNHEPFLCADWEWAPADDGFLSRASRISATDELVNVPTDTLGFAAFLASRGVLPEVANGLKFRARSFSAKVARVQVSGGHTYFGLLLESDTEKGVDANSTDRSFPSAMMETLYQVVQNELLVNSAQRALRGMHTQSGT